MKPIIIVDSDREDADFLEQSFVDAGAAADFRYFNSPFPALEYLKTTKDKPAVIISDMNMPGMNGLLFKRAINRNIDGQDKTIPFFFFSASMNADLVGEANCLSVQGYFQKPDNITDFDIVAMKIKCYLDNRNAKTNHLFNC